MIGSQHHHSAPNLPAFCFVPSADRHARAATAKDNESERSQSEEYSEHAERRPMLFVAGHRPHRRHRCNCTRAHCHPSPSLSLALSLSLRPSVLMSLHHRKRSQLATVMIWNIGATKLGRRGNPAQWRRHYDSCVVAFVAEANREERPRTEVMIHRPKHEMPKKKNT